MGAETQFSVKRIIGITIRDKYESHYKWLPKKQKTFFFGLFKRNSWHQEGFYSYGSYTECYESGCWDSRPVNEEELRESGLIVDENKIVWRKPLVTVHLESKKEVNRYFDTIIGAKRWAEILRNKNGEHFEIIEQ